MPILITLRAFLGNTIARIGGWLVAGISVLAVLKWRDWSARRQGRAEVETAVREAALRKREEMAAVQRPGDGEVAKSLREGRF